MQLNELLRSASLYHGTSFLSAVTIIDDNAFRDKTEQTIPSIGVVTGISFTRNRAFARDCGSVVFELDRDRLAQRHRLIPLNYWIQSVTRGFRTLSDARKEAEEFVIGPIAPADRYITAILVSGRDLQSRKTRPETIALDQKLLAHPLVRVV